MVKSIVVVTLFSILTLSAIPNYAQSESASYYEIIAIADSLKYYKDFTAACKLYTKAFEKLGWKGYPLDRYNAGCAWAQVGNPDSAFYQLEKIAMKTKYSDYDFIIADSELVSLHNDVRWKKLLAQVRSNQEAEEVMENKPLVKQLAAIHEADQEGRKSIDDVRTRYGNGSKEMKELWKSINEKDSLNLIEIIKIIDTYGWLGEDSIGTEGNSTLFLVIQHADIKTQEKYLPIMKEAVANGRARASDLALLIDRVEMRNDRPQVYGSQISYKNGENIIYPIVDEKNVNKRRAEVGLQPLEDYVLQWGIIWSAENIK